MDAWAVASKLELCGARVSPDGDVNQAWCRYCSGQLATSDRPLSGSCQYRSPQLCVRATAAGHAQQRDTLLHVMSHHVTQFHNSGNGKARSGKQRLRNGLTVPYLTSFHLLLIAAPPACSHILGINVLFGRTSPLQAPS
ncbi:hypothetical protein J6590_041328 [Homalodisca vitripennis]|nr:hypothetical protein J6590_041328 [Homalodisca vitripennis]